MAEDRFDRRRSTRPHSVDAHPQAAPANLERPPPEFPPWILRIHREEDDLGAAHQILHRHEADAIHETAVGGVVAVVAHREDMVGRHQVFRRVVHLAFVGRLQDVMLDAVRQRLLILPHHHVDAARHRRHSRPPACAGRAGR